MTTVKYPTAVVSVFIWIGFLCAISFMESWLKFKAPGVTLPIGLGIGSIVFNALNKIECVMAIFIIGTILFSKEPIFSIANTAFLIPLVLLIAQTFWLLPALDGRAQLLIDGLQPPPSNLHYYFVILEVIKLISLTIFGMSLFKTTTL